MTDLTPFLLAHAFWVWLAIAAVCLTAEVVSGSGWLLWPAGSAALVGVLALVAPVSAPVQPPLFAAFTIVTTYAGRRLLRRGATPGRDVNDPHARLIGHHGTVAAGFQTGAGRVFVDGKEWSAEIEGGGVLAPGARIVVIALLGGARLRVRPA